MKVMRDGSALVVLVDTLIRRVWIETALCIGTAVPDDVLERKNKKHKPGGLLV